MTIDEIIGSLSLERFSTYKNSVFNGTTDNECLGIYLWNKQIASVFLPALQVLEVSLRNAIYQAKITYETEQIEKNHPQNQWANLKNNIDRKWFISAMTKANNEKSYRQIQVADKKITEEGKSKTPENYIAKLTFGFWVSLVDKKFNAPTATYLKLWPHLTNKVFPHALSNQGTQLSIRRIGDDLRDMNELRNRLSHHEPLWKTKTTYNFEQAINKIVRDYKKCLTLIHWINPSNLKLLSIIDNNDKMRDLCNIHSLWKNKQLPNGVDTLPSIDIEKFSWHILMNSRLEGKIINIDIPSGYSMIDCTTEGKKFIAKNTNFHRCISQFSVNDIVTFEPNSITSGSHPQATEIKRK